MRNSETLRSALFEQIAGLQNGSVKPETAKATASCAMAICKTVELDLRASELFKEGGGMSPLQLTSEQSSDDVRSQIISDYKKGLPLATIASRTKLSRTDVMLIIETNCEHKVA